MNRRPTHTDLGEPDLRVAGLQLWVHGRKLPDAEDSGDGNWLIVTAHCGALRASVWTQGAICEVTAIAGFGDQCAAMYRGESKSAVLDPIEPELQVLLETVDRLGHVRARVEITPDHISQSHRFQFEIDRSDLSNIARQCARIVQEYPIRGRGET